MCFLVPEFTSTCIVAISSPPPCSRLLGLNSRYCFEKRFIRLGSSRPPLEHDPHADSFTREQKLNLRLHSPVLIAGGCLHITPKLCARIEELVPHLEDATEAPAHWHSPAVVSMRLPICSYDRAGHDVPAARKVVVNERIQGQLIELPAFSSRPYVVDKCTKKPMALLGQNHCGRSGAPLVDSQLLV